MGNAKSEERKEFEVKVNHPKFTKAKIVTNNSEKYLETQIAIDEKEYDKWKLATSKYQEPPYNLLLPVKSTFHRTAMCGHTGNATVPSTLPRSTTRTTPTSSPKRSMTVEAKKPDPKKSRSGFCSTVWSEPEIKLFR
jgi:hypothetical protein